MPLISKNHLEQATEAIHRLRSGGKHAVDDSAIQAEVAEIRGSYEQQRRLQHGSSWVALFGKTHRHRTLVAIGLQCLQQAQGVGFLGNYLAITLLQLGITNVFLILLILYVVLLLCSCFGFVLPDYHLNVCHAAIATVHPAPVGAPGTVLVLFVFKWIAVFAVSWGSLPWTISAELSSPSLREKTVAVGSWMGFAVGLIVTFITPYLLNPVYANLGAKIGYLWVSFSVVSGVWAVFMVPETKGRTLEELEYMFEAGVPIRKFASHNTSEILATKLLHQADNEGRAVALHTVDDGEKNLGDDKMDRDVYAPILTPGTLPASTQLTTQHQRCQEIFTGSKEARLGSLYPEQAKAVVEASSKLGRVWLTTIPFQPSLRLTDFEVAAALQLRTLTGEREAHCTRCGEANFFVHPEVCLQRKPWRVARHKGAKRIIGQALASTPGTRVRLEPLGHQTSRRNNIQVFSLLGVRVSRERAGSSSRSGLAAVGKG
ncbi:hypothetical protein JCM24511_02028 [Saitozyma sp. JCM 24511]|nr:hypothetical protein JCM24511_02028 [Saitozyma sp. JCM 24511]